MATQWRGRRVVLDARRDKGSLAPPDKRENDMVTNDMINFDPVRVIKAASTPGGEDEPLGILSLAEVRGDRPLFLHSLCLDQARHFPKRVQSSHSLRHVYLLIQRCAHSCPGPRWLLQAKAAAEEEELDLVLLSSTSDPPVVKIANAGKMRYAAELKKKENLKKTNTKDIKEVKLTYNIGQADYDVRAKNAKKFLEAGHRVKCTIMFKGREQQHSKWGASLREQLAARGRWSPCFVFACPELNVGVRCRVAACISVRQSTAGGKCWSRSQSSARRSQRRTGRGARATGSSFSSSQRRRRTK